MEYCEPVQLVVTDHFTGRLQATVAAVTDLPHALARLDATWEPHDWSEGS